MKKGLLVILSGPSGVGKGSVRLKIFENKRVPLVYSVSMTTRSIRPGEEEGREYYYVSREEFQRNIDSGNLLEWAEFVGNRYGTPKDKLEKNRDEGRNVLLEIEVQGTRQILEKYKDDPRVVSIFLVPPSMEALEERIRGRKSEPDDVIKARLAKAESELPLKVNYQYVICNQTIEQSAREIEDIILSRM